MSEKSNIPANANQGSPQEKGEGKFRQVLGFWPLVFFGVVSMVPTAPIVYYATQQPETNGYTWICYAIASFLIALTAMSYQKMLHKIPNSGSVYSYASYALGPRVGFVFGWGIVLDYFLTPLFVLGIVADYLSSIFPIPYWATVLILGIVLTAIGCLGVQTSVTSEILIGIFTVVLVILFLFFGLKYMAVNDIPLFTKQSVYDADKINWSGVFSASSLALLAFCGFDAITTFAEETKLTLRKFSWTLMAAAMIEAAIMVSTTFVAAAATDWTTFTDDELSVAYYTLIKEWSSVGLAKAMAVGSQVCMATCILAFIIGTARIFYSMGRDHVLPFFKFFGHLSPKTDVPVYGAILTGVVGIIGALFFNWQFISTIVSFGACLGFIGVNISVIAQYWVKEKDHKIFRHLLFPLIASIGIGYVMTQQTKECLIVGTIWTVVGIIWILYRYSHDKEYRELADSGRINTDIM